MLYRILLFSVKPQHESATGIHISPPFWASLPCSSPSHPSRLIQRPYLSFLSHTTNSPFAVYFTYGNVSFHVTLSIYLTLSSPLDKHFWTYVLLFSHKASPKLKYIYIYIYTYIYTHTHTHTRTHIFLGVKFQALYFKKHICVGSVLETWEY